MPQKLQIDRWLFSATVGLALFGVVMVYSASAMIAQQENHSQFFYLGKQALWTSIGFVAMFVAMRFDYQQLNSRWIVYGLFALTLLLLVAVFGFSPINGARRWIKLRGFSIQPSEIAKLSLTLFLARFLQRRVGDESSFWRTFLTCFFVRSSVKSWDWSARRSSYSCSQFSFGAACAQHCALRIDSACCWESES